MSRLRAIIALEVLLFGAASLVHAGILATGYEHSRAATAEGVIAAVLLLGLILSTVPSLPARGLLLGRADSRCSARWSAPSPSPSGSARRRRETSSSTLFCSPS